MALTTKLALLPEEWLGDGREASHNSNSLWPMQGAALTGFVDSTISSKVIFYHAFWIVNIKLCQVTSALIGIS